MVDDTSMMRKRNTSVLFRSSSGVLLRCTVLPTPFSQITYCHERASQVTVSTHIDLVVVTRLAPDSVWERKASTEQQIHSTAEETVHE